MMTVSLTNGRGIIRAAPPELLDAISDGCSFAVKGAEKSELYRKGRWDGRRKMFDKSTRSFLIGLWPRVREIIGDHEYRLVDSRTIPERSLDLNLVESVEMRGYQREAVISAMVDGQCIIQAATGAGKTVMAACLIAQLKCRALFVVHTRDLLYQAKNEISKFLGVEVGQVGDGIVDVRDVTIATMQTISKYLGVEYKKYEYDDEDYVDETDISSVRGELAKLVKADLIIWDEVHRVACETAHDIMTALTHAYYRIGLSASPWRDDGSDLMIEAAMGRVSYVVSASYLIDREYLVQPIIRMHGVRGSVPWFEDERPFDTIYREQVVENDARHEIVLKYVRQFAEMDIPTLILVQQIKHGKALQQLIRDRFHPVEFISGRDLTDKRTQTIQQLRDGEIHILLASTIADEGLDIKRLSGLILAGGGKSSTRALQRIGRTLRPFEGKKAAYIVDIVDDTKYLRDHAERRKAIYRTEPGFIVLET